MPPDAKPARQIAGELLIDIFGPDAEAAHLAILQLGEPGMRAIEAYAGVFRPAPMGELGQRTEGRREVFFWLRALRTLDPGELKQLMPKGDDDDAS
jgi:hypothetical protein